MKTVSLYNGEVQIEFDEDKHFYHVVGMAAKPDGVTTILELVPKFLLNWAARCAVDHIVSGYMACQEAGEMLETTSFLSLCDEAKGAWRVKRDKAGDTGTLVHKYAEGLIAGRDDMPPEDAPHYKGCMAFRGWWESVGPLDPVPNETQDKSERIIFSRRLFYAGTCDLFALQHGRPTVFDFKTSSDFYDSHPLQVGGYALALEEELGIEIKDGWIIHIDKETGKCTPYFVEVTPELKKDWEAVRIAWRAIKRNQDRHKHIRKDRKWKAPTSANIIQAEAAAP